MSIDNQKKMEYKCKKQCPRDGAKHCRNLTKKGVHAIINYVLNKIYPI